MAKTVVLLLVVAFAQIASGQTPVDAQLKSVLEPMLRSHRGNVALAIRNLKSDVHYEFRADAPMPTASLIKLPIMIATYRMADAGKLDLSRPTRLKAGDKVPGSGILSEHFSDNIALPLRDFVRLMIRYSDNTATNVVVDQIGLRTTTDVMESLGLVNTKLHSKLYRGDTTIFPERSQEFGIGSTTANELVQLLRKFETNQLATNQSTEAMRNHMLCCDDDSKLAAKLPRNIRFAHKTGAIANCRTDAGILYTDAGPVAVCFLSNKNEDQSWADQNEANVLAGTIGESIVNRFGAPDADGRLQVGSFGRIVESLQRTLNQRLTPSPNLAIDGDFGPATRSAVERFQREQRIDANGIVTKATWNALGTLIETEAPVPPPHVVNSERLPLEPQASLDSPPIVTAKAWAIADQAGKVTFSYNGNKPLQAASTTKIMTAFVVIRYAQRHPDILAEMVEFSTRADNTVGSTSGLRTGEKVTVHELLYGLMLPSGNDASVALAEHFGSRLADKKDANANESYNLFVSTMNSTAIELGMVHTHYQNTHGLPHEKHLTSAEDLIRLTHESMKYELFRNLAQTRQFGCQATGPGGYQRNVLWKNTNRLLSVEGFSGVKTGTTSAAGACLVAVGERDGDELTVVTLGSSSSAARYADSRNLYRWAWQTRAHSSNQ